MTKSSASNIQFSTLFDLSPVSQAWWVWLCREWNEKWRKSIFWFSGLGLFESPLFSATHEEESGGRSVPTTPLQVSAPGISPSDWRDLIRSESPTPFFSISAALRRQLLISRRVLWRQNIKSVLFFPILLLLLLLQSQSSLRQLSQIPASSPLSRSPWWARQHRAYWYQVATPGRSETVFSWSQTLIGEAAAWTLSEF